MTRKTEKQLKSLNTIQLIEEYQSAKAYMTKNNNRDTISYFVLVQQAWVNSQKP